MAREEGAKEEKADVVVVAVSGMLADDNKKE
jgi:hypothetical protein